MRGKIKYALTNITVGFDDVRLPYLNKGKFWYLSAGFGFVGGETDYDTTLCVNQRLFRGIKTYHSVALLNKWKEWFCSAKNWNRVRCHLLCKTTT